MEGWTATGTIVVRAELPYDGELYTRGLILTPEVVNKVQ